jgi:DNA-binding CsgD family transcriptional regulator
MKINVFASKDILLNYLTEVDKNLNGLIEFSYHQNIPSLLNYLNLSQGTEIVLLDIENDYYQSYLPDLTKNKAVKLVAIGNGMGIDVLYKLYNTKLFSLYVDFSINSFEFYTTIQQLTSANFVIPNKYMAPFFEYHMSKVKPNAFDFMVDVKTPQEKDYNKPNISNIKPFSDKEQTVCELLTKGYSYKDIGNIMNISTHTVNQKAKSIYKKLNVNSRGELVYKLLK